MTCGRSAFTIAAIAAARPAKFEATTLPYKAATAPPSNVGSEMASNGARSVPTYTLYVMTFSGSAFGGSSGGTIRKVPPHPDRTTTVTIAAAVSLHPCFNLDFDIRNLPIGSSSPPADRGLPPWYPEVVRAS